MDRRLWTGDDVTIHQVALPALDAGRGRRAGRLDVGGVLVLAGSVTPAPALPVAGC